MLQGFGCFFADLVINSRKTNWNFNTKFFLQFERVSKRLTSVQKFEIRLKFGPFENACSFSFRLSIDAAALEISIGECSFLSFFFLAGIQALKRTVYRYAMQKRCQSWGKKLKATLCERVGLSSAVDLLCQLWSFNQFLLSNENYCPFGSVFNVSKSLFIIPC